MRALSLPLLGSLAATAQAIAFAGPQPTNGLKAEAGWTPKPTDGPMLDYGPDLRKRQIQAWPRTCGWVDGDLSNPLTCGFSTATCAFYMPNNQRGMAGCCSTDYQNCFWANSCMDSAAISRSSCGPDCWANSFIRKCTAITRPYCVSWTWTDAKVADYGCGTNPASTWATIQTYVSNYIALPVSAPQGAVRVPSTTSSTPTPVSTPLRPGPTTPIPVNDDSGPSIGVIVGAAIGGVAVLAILLGLVIFFCVRNKKKQRQQQMHGQPTYNPSAGPPPPTYMAPQGQQPQTGYFPPNPNTMSMMSTNGADNKYNPNVAAYATSQISSPGSPAPPYDRKPVSPPPQQGYGQTTLNVPQQGYVAPHDGAVEIQSAPAPAPYQAYKPPGQESAPQQPTQQVQRKPQRQQGEVYEIGS